eukprot:2634460-Rhodomonas_salina.2
MMRHCTALTRGDHSQHRSAAVELRQCRRPTHHLSPQCRGSKGGRKQFVVTKKTARKLDQVEQSAGEARCQCPVLRCTLT